MHTNFLSRVALVLLAGFLVVATQAFALTTLQWLVVGGGIAAIVIAAADAIVSSPVQRAIDGLVAVLGAWMIVAALVFTGGAMLWLSFAGAVALGFLALTGLVIHELRTERVVHELRVTRRAGEPIAA